MSVREADYKIFFIFCLSFLMNERELVFLFFFYVVKLFFLVLVCLIDFFLVFLSFLLWRSSRKPLLFLSFFFSLSDFLIPHSFGSKFISLPFFFDVRTHAHHCVLAASLFFVHIPKKPKRCAKERPQNTEEKIQKRKTELMHFLYFITNFKKTAVKEVGNSEVMT